MSELSAGLKQQREFKLREEDRAMSWERMNPAIQQLYDSLVHENDLNKLIDREESLYLEFKQKQNANHDLLDEKERYAFAEALSAFANADGGILIFGIKTTKVEGVDRAVALKAIKGHESFRSKLADSVIEATQPIIDGVRIETISSSDGRGFVKCLIPASDKFPHREMRKHQYFRRTSTGSNRRMDHSELADAFGRRQRPSLSLWVQLRFTAEPGVEELQLCFKNEGRGVARHAGMLCTLRDATVLRASGGLSDITSINTAATLQFYEGQGVIHPNNIMRSLGKAMVSRPTVGALLEGTVQWYAEDMDTREVDMAISADQPIRQLVWPQT